MYYIADNVQTPGLVTEVYDESGKISINPHAWVMTRNFDCESTHTAPGQARVSTRNVNSARVANSSSVTNRGGLDISSSRPGLNDTFEFESWGEADYDIDDEFGGLSILDQDTTQPLHVPLSPMQSAATTGALPAHNVDTRPRCK